MDQPALNLTNCDREPIHQPGSIQPHGVLIVCDPRDLVITHVSENLRDHCAWTAEQAICKELKVLLGDAAAGQHLTDQLRAVTDHRPSYLFTLMLKGTSTPFDAIAHRSGENLFLEFEPATDEQGHTAPQLYRMVQQAVAQFQSASSVDELCRIAARQVQQINGFDRVMTYRFDKEWNGTVVAEVKRNDLEPFLGLHYPASDIPQQARALYTKNWLRFIANRDYVPARVIPEVGAATARPLDMSFSVLRSVSPIHLEYLKNMGVEATMSVSLIRDGRLWGLIACHHYSPRFVTYDIRTACELLGQFMSLSLAAAEDRELADYRKAMTRTVGEMMTNVERTEDITDALLKSQPNLLSLLAADGVAVLSGNRITRLGQTPSEDVIRQLSQWASENVTESVFATDQLDSIFGSAILGGIASGVLVVSLSARPAHQLFWFRPEQVRRVDWAGDPRKSIVSGPNQEPRLSPRGSFALWKETVRGRSEPWLPIELEGAQRLRDALTSLLLQRTEKIAASNFDLRLASAEKEKALETERAARAESERLHRMKDEFVATLSHELRTPLNAILGWTQVLAHKSGVTPDISGGLEVIERNARSQAQMIEDLLDVSRIIAGKLNLDLQDTHLPAIIERAIETVSLAAHSKGVRIETIIDPMPDIQTTGDPQRLQQIAWNLLSNAVKFTPRGGKVQVVLERVASHVEFTVSDNGKGIKSEFLPYVFDRFRQEESSSARSSTGLGLGLSIVRNLVELHGGNVRAFSRGENQGAQFVVALPLRVFKNEVPGEPTTAMPVQDYVQINVRGLRILEVDDEEDSRKLIQALFEECECSVTMCFSADDALQKLEAGSFDVILSDIGMPGRDGYDLMRTWRAKEAALGRQKIPAIALTAYARSDDRLRALMAGFQAHIPKPVDRGELLATVASLTGRV